MLADLVLFYCSNGCEGPTGPTCTAPNHITGTRTSGPEGYYRKAMNCSRATDPPHMGVYQSYGVPFLGVPIIRIILNLGLYWAPSILGNYHIASYSAARAVLRL